jgi:hypothetical protein
MNKKFILLLTSKKAEYLMLTIVFTVGFLLRLYKINNPIADWHSWRQADTAAVTRNYVKDGIDLLKPRFDDVSSIQSRLPNPEGYRMVEFPFYNAVSAILFNLQNTLTLEVVSRLVTIASAVITALFLYLLGNRYLKRYGGILSAFFYLFIPFNIYFTRVILADPMGVMFGVIAIWYFSKFTEIENNIYFYLSAIFMSAAFLIKPYLGFYLLPIYYLAGEKYGFKNRKLLLKSILYLFLAFIPFAAWRAWEAKFPEGIPLFWWAFNGSGIRFRPAYWNWVYGERLGHLILGSMGVIPFVFGLLSGKIKSFANFFMLGVLIYFTVVASANVMHDYYQILIMPAVSITLAAGTIYLWNQNTFNKNLTRVILVFSVGVMLINGWYQIKGNYAVNKPELIEAGNKVDEITPKDAIVVAPYNGDTAFLYQTKRRGWPAVDDSMENIIKKGADYYVSVDLRSTDTLNFEKIYKTLIKTDKYIILNLLEEVE